MLKLKRTLTVALTVALRLPTENPNTFNEGTITCQVEVLTKDRIRELSEAETTDSEYIDILVKSVDGLGDENGTPITGDAALAEVKTGHFSGFLQAAILTTYFEQFGESRVKNSKTSRRR